MGHVERHATAYSNHAECARRGRCRTWRKCFESQNDCGLTKTTCLLDDVAETSHYQRAVIPRLGQSKECSTGLFHNVLLHLDEQESDCALEWAHETETAEHAPAPSENASESEQATWVLKVIWSPLDSLDVRFRQMGI